MSVELVAAIVERQHEAVFVRLLRDADAEFHNAGFEESLAEILRRDPHLCDRWVTWSGDQRWTPSAYLEGTETGWFDCGSQYVRVHADPAAAAADFIHRMAAWLASGKVVTN